MMKTEELFSEAVSFPVDLKTQLIKELLQSLHPMQQVIDDLWAQEA